MPLCRAVDDKSRVAQKAGLEPKHPSRLQRVPSACIRVCLKVGRKCILEFKGNTATHYADAIDGIDEHLDVRLQDVSRCKFNARHGGSIVPIWKDMNSRTMRRQMQRIGYKLCARRIAHTD